MIIHKITTPKPLYTLINQYTYRDHAIKNQLTKFRDRAYIPTEPIHDDDD